jgi:hypothetical protein
MEKTPFYVRTKSANGSFVDHETAVNVHGNNVTKIDAPVGKKTMQWLKAGGLVVVKGKALEKALEEEREIENDVFSTKTRIVMKDAPKGSQAATAGMKVPVEVPLTEEELAQRNPTDEDLIDDHFEVEDDEDEDEDEDEDDEDNAAEEPGLDEALKAAGGKKVKKDGKAPAFTKKSTAK